MRSPKDFGHAIFMNTLKPWPEEPAPSWVDPEFLCQKVSGKRFVFGEGNPQGPLCIILDNPGEREQRDGTPYVCGTRETLRFALKEAKIPDDLVYTTFLFKCRPLRKYDREEAIKVHLPVLQRQLTENPKICLAALGDTVIKALFGPRTSVKELRGRWLTWLDTPLRAGYHPLACRRRRNLLPLLAEDLTAVKELIS